MTDLPSQRERGPLSPGIRTDAGVLPIVSIAGTRGKSTVAWMLSAIVESAGRPYASWLSSGVYIDGDLQQGELGPWSKVVLAARHHEIDVAIQEMAASTVIAAGLPEHTYPIVVLTTLCGNNEACLLSSETEIERRSLETVVRAARSDGTIVANADDYDIVAMVEDAEPEVILYALHPENPALQRHIARGGRAVWLEDDWIHVGTREGGESLLAASDIPATLDGVILFQVQNALAATAAALAIGLSTNDVAGGLRCFEPGPDTQPAACNIIRYNQATLLIDSPRQVLSLRMLARGIRHMPHRRTLVVTGSFPGLEDEHAREAGRILGDLAGIVLLHGENASEGRMTIIKAGIASATVPPIVLSIADETRAIDHVLNTIGQDDVALVIADNPEAVLAHLWPAPVISAEPQRQLRTMRAL